MERLFPALLPSSAPSLHLMCPQQTILYSLQTQECSHSCAIYLLSCSSRQNGTEHWTIMPATQHMNIKQYYRLNQLLPHLAQYCTTASTARSIIQDSVQSFQMAQHHYYQSNSVLIIPEQGWWQHRHQSFEALSDRMACSQVHQSNRRRTLHMYTTFNCSSMRLAKCVGQLDCWSVHWCITA